MKPAEYAKAIVGAITAGLTTLATAMDDGVTGPEVVGVIVAMLVTFGGVFTVPNADPLAPRPMRRREAGHGDVLYWLVVALCICALVIMLGWMAGRW
jgi:hypothetical protein